jgi:hypothetical protein
MTLHLAESPLFLGKDPSLEVNQSAYPQLPQFPDGIDKDTAIACINSSGIRTYYMEQVFSILLTACIRHGKWDAVSESEFLAIAESCPLFYMVHFIVDGMYELSGQGKIEIVCVDNQQYIILQPELVAEFIGNGQGIYFMQTTEPNQAESGPSEELPPTSVEK